MLMKLLRPFNAGTLAPRFRGMALALAAASFSLPALAQGVPTPSQEETRKVVDYFLKGKDSGPILLEFSPCKKTNKGLDGKLVCEEQITGAVKKGDPIIAYVKFFVPKGAKYDDLKIKFLLNGEVRSTSDFTLTESWTGYANYKQTTASKPGTWEMQVLRGDTLLQSHKVTVE
jgi:hypothetical protein